MLKTYYGALLILIDKPKLASTFIFFRLLNLLLEITYYYESKTVVFM